MKSAIARLAQYSLLAGSLTLVSTASLHAQEVHSTDLSAPRTLQEAGLDAAPLRAIAATDPSNPASPTPASPAPAETKPPTYQPISAQIGGSFTSGPGTGYDSSYFDLAGFVPLAQTPGESISYLQGRLLLSTQNGNPSGNLILGHRVFNPKTNTIWGGYLGMDVRDTGRKTFTQLGAGVEAVLPNVEFRVNGYLPLGSRRRQTSENSVDTTLGTANQITATRFQGNSLLFDLSGSQQQRTTTRNYEVSLAGFDAEAGVTLWRWSPVGTLKSYLGLYYYDGPRISGFVGIRGRLEAKINENFYAGLAIQGDREFGTRAVVSIGFRFPGARSTQDSPQQAAWARVADSPVRQSNIAVTHRSTTDVTIVGATPATTVVALNPATNQPWVFQHVILGSAAGNGTFENPFATVANGLAATQTDGNSIVYVQAGTNPGIPTFTIPDQVQVLSTGPVQTLSTVQAGTVQLPFSGAGTLPKVTDTIKMGNNTVLSGFAVTPPTGSTAILANGVQNVTIRDNQAPWWCRKLFQDSDEIADSADELA